jgi:thiol-disulfide isomerase/thioredoxin
MSAIEDRIRAATRAVAQTVAPGSTPPPPPLPARQRRGPVTYPRRERGWPGWVAPLAAAAAVAAAIATSMVVSSALSLDDPAHTAAQRTVAGAGPVSGPAKTHDLGQAKNFDLSVLGQPGRHLSLESMAGRPVIVNFFASWCAPCQKQTLLIARFYRARGGRVFVIGIDVNDSAHAALSFIHKSGVTYPVAVDPMPMKTATAYNLPGLPATFFLNARHTIVKRVFGPVTEAGLSSGASLMAQRAG